MTSTKCYFRSGLLEDLGFETAKDFADAIGYEDLAHVQAALSGERPSKSLLTAILRTYLTVPLLYFVERGK